jgi:asparagine synthase (glutamine-hydrolysing)
MCGFVGIYDPSGLDKDRFHESLGIMNSRIAHRGPDDCGFWIDTQSGIGIGHRRLSIQDLSDAGHQPMVSESGRYVLVFNGEIYNHLDIRKLFDNEQRVRWRGRSDTETLLVAIEKYGVEIALNMSAGMFAIALWDRYEKSLQLARDRMGEKPLYYGWQNGVFLFGSELKALQSHPNFDNTVNSNILPIYLGLGYIPEPWTVWKNLRKVPSGSLVSIDQRKRGFDEEVKKYWNFKDVIEKGSTSPFLGDGNQAITKFGEELAKTIRRQTLADVPVGAFLSGGIDSSTIAAILQANSGKRIKTFTIGFNESEFSELEHARRVSKHLGTDHAELIISANDAIKVIPSIPRIYDEPFGDPSSIPTIILSQFARRSVSVALSGDGGDELFGGYTRYFNNRAKRFWKATQFLPKSIRRLFASLFRDNAEKVANLLNMGQKFRKDKNGGMAFDAKCIMAANLLNSSSEFDYYKSINLRWNPLPITSRCIELPYGFSADDLMKIDEPVLKMMAHDCVSYLPDNILFKVDRAAMSVGLETRVPLMDHELVELVWRMPYSFKVRDDQTKWLLRRVLNKYVPPEIMDRPKMGFNLPLNRWLRTTLKDWAESLLTEESLCNNCLEPRIIRRRWQDFQIGKTDEVGELWFVLMWQLWTKG